MAIGIHISISMHVRYNCGINCCFSPFQMDPELARTVVVSTKLDTRIPQFGRAADVELFLRPPARLLDGNILGSTPFFS